MSPDPYDVLCRYMMYRYSSFAPSVSDWAFDTYHDGQVISYYLAAYYQSFLMIVGNSQVRWPDLMCELYNVRHLIV